MIRVLGVFWGVLWLIGQPAGAQTDNAVEIIPLTTGVWVHRSYHTFETGVRYPSNGMVVEDGSDVILIDTAWTPGQTEALLTAIVKHTGRQVTRAIVTHAHDDRLGGVDILIARGIPVFAHPETIRLAQEYENPVPDTSLPLTSVPISLLRMGMIEIAFPGAGHAVDNIVVWLPKHQILFGGCLVRELADQRIPAVPGMDAAAWPGSIERLMSRYGRARIVVPGHGRVGSAALLMRTHALAEDMKTAHQPPEH